MTEEEAHITQMQKKKIKKIRKKAEPSRVVKKAAPPKKVLIPLGKPMGEVTHYYRKIKVAILKFKKPVKLGAKIRIKGVTSNFEETIKSMQFNHQAVKVAKPKQQVGIKTSKRAREGDQIYIVK